MQQNKRIHTHTHQHKARTTVLKTGTQITGPKSSTALATNSAARDRLLFYLMLTLRSMLLLLLPSALLAWPTTTRIFQVLRF
jgi:hypothetical protein